MVFANPLCDLAQITERFGPNHRTIWPKSSNDLAPFTERFGANNSALCNMVLFSWLQKAEKSY